LAGDGRCRQAPEVFVVNDMKGRASRKVAVLGPIPRDQIVTHAGERFHKYGCVMYTAVALSALLEARDAVVPISHGPRPGEGTRVRSSRSWGPSRTSTPPA